MQRQPTLFEDEQPIEPKAQGPELFTPERWVAEKRPVQKKLFSGLDCLPGQMDLFCCDGDREP